MKLGQVTSDRMTAARASDCAVVMVGGGEVLCAKRRGLDYIEGSDSRAIVNHGASGQQDRQMLRRCRVCPSSFPRSTASAVGPQMGHFKGHHLLLEEVEHVAAVLERVKGRTLLRAYQPRHSATSVSGHFES